LVDDGDAAPVISSPQDEVIVASSAAAPALPCVAIATGDPAGIGPEISLKAAIDPQVRAICRPLIVGDPGVLERHAGAAGITAPISVIASPHDADWSNGAVHVLAAPLPEPADIVFGTVAAVYGRAALASCRRAIRAALDGEAGAVVAAPHNQTSIAAAGIAFDGYPGFLAGETGMNRNDVFLMLCFGDRRIVHCTLHVSVVDAVALITPAHVGRAIRATNAALKRLGIARPKIFVSGLNPHAGEGGLFGREEIDVIAPAIAAARAGIDVDGPFGCDTMFQKAGADAFIVMLHDQGQIPAKLLAFNQSAALAIGSPIMFSSVAHGSAFDIAGKGVASPAALIAALRVVTGHGI
jgi:4-hydroxythreonine-4-phosphate dehydrogenase